jgi:hypothetical protein
MSDELLKAQINALIRDEIQETINEYVDKEDAGEVSRQRLGEITGDSDKSNGFKDEELTVNIPNDEVDRILKEYKKIKKRQKSNLGQIKKLGLVDKHGRQLKQD